MLSAKYEIKLREQSKNFKFCEMRQHPAVRTSRPPADPAPQCLLAEVLALAEAAGRAILALYQRHQDGADASVHLGGKDDGSPLTQADLAAHRVIEQGLRALRPDWPVVSEEGRHAGPEPGGSCWLVDPLDGTREFLAGNGEFTVNIALVRGGVALWGVVHAPALGESFWGGGGLGAWRHGHARGEAARVAIRVASAPEPAQVCRVIASRSHADPATQELLRGLGDIQALQAGSSLKFCRVAQGLAHVYPRLAPTCHWDTAAGQAVLEGAGGCVLDLAGQPLRYPEAGGRLNPGFVAACAPLQQWRTGRAPRGSAGGVPA